MEKDVVKYLKEKGKSEQFISLILKICKDNDIIEKNCLGLPDKVCQKVCQKNTRQQTISRNMGSYKKYINKTENPRVSGSIPLRATNEW